MQQRGAKFQAVYFDAFASDGLLEEFQKFRKRLFLDDLGWKLANVDGREIDQFDREDAIYCILRQDGHIVAGFRAIRTDFPYLAEEIFPQLATLKPYPKRPDYWEISRFGAFSGKGDRRPALLNYALMFRFAIQHQLRSLVAVVDVTHERLLCRLNVKTQRYGLPAIVGTDTGGKQLICVAGEIPVWRQFDSTIQFFGCQLSTVEIVDETLVQRHTCLSA